MARLPGEQLDAEDWNRAWDELARPFAADAGAAPQPAPAAPAPTMQQFQTTVEPAAPEPAAEEDPVLSGWRELQALRARRRGPAAVEPQPEPEVGTSPLAQELERAGRFFQLEQDHRQTREEARQEAIRESSAQADRGWIEHATEGATSAVRSFFGVGEAFQRAIRQEGGVFGEAGRVTSPERQRELAEEELETRQWTAPLSRAAAEAYPAVPEGLGPAAEGAFAIPLTAYRFTRGLLGANATRQEQALARAQQMMRGEAALPQMEQWRSLVDSGGRTITEMFTSLPVEYAGIIGGYAMGATEGRFVNAYGLPFPEFVDNRLYQFGQRMEHAVQRVFPGDPARQFEFAHTLVQGLASTAAFGGQGVIAHLLGAGARGQIALITLSGMAAQTPPEFARVTKAMAEGTAEERDRIVAMLVNSALGATESMPFAKTLAGDAVGLMGRLARGGEQAIEEMVQESFQQIGSNVTRRLTYDPNQDPYEGVLEAIMTALVSGGLYGAAASGGRQPSQQVQAGNCIAGHAGIAERVRLGGRR